MSTSTKTPISQAIRVRQVWLRHIKLDRRSYLIIAVESAIMLVLMLVVPRFAIPFSVPISPLRVYLLAFFVLAPPLLWGPLTLWLLDHLRARRLRACPTTRERRLLELASSPGAIRRFPQRVCELEMTRPLIWRRKLKAKFLEFAPAQVIIVDSRIDPPTGPQWWRNLVNDPKFEKRRALFAKRTGSGELFFEPMDLQSGHDELASLAWFARTEELNATSSSDTELEELRREITRASKLSQRSNNSWQFLIVFPLLLLAAYLAGVSTKQTLILAGLMLLFLPLILQDLLKPHWFLVPGALISRPPAWWPGRQCLTIYRPADTPLFVDNRTGNIWLRDKKTVRKFRFLPGLGPTLATAWLSTARSPTDAEIHSFLGHPSSPPQAA